MCNKWIGLREYEKRDKIAHKECMKEIVTLECGHSFLKEKLRYEWKYLEELLNQRRTN